MTTFPAPDAVSISSLNTLEYCPRRFYYQFVQCDMLVNEFVLEGTLQHQRVHQSGQQTTGEGEMQTTHLYLYSETLHLSGFTDVVEEQGGMLVPVEYKHGRQGEWLNDSIQLCAQALCLEERQPGKIPIAHGYIYYLASRRRVQVNFTPELRQQTLDAIARAFAVAALDKAPPPLEAPRDRRCLNCSLQPLCMPDEVKMLQARKAS
ncbi:MAG TPA: CRISPR-associated protein Cas4 [Ktedonobacteraceae bacterium]|nr:CRISPR-associated protein Cas4 [Ktedonobacteraceae bacterium]